MTLTDSQKDQVRQWLLQGSKLSEVQKRLESDFGLRPTYMEVRFLVDDLKVIPKDPELPKKVVPPPGPSSEAKSVEQPLGLMPALAEPSPASAGVKVMVDSVTRPGTMVSGRATFSDGESATWYIDQMGRPGLSPETKGYRPSKADMQEFQLALEQELVKLGF
jgi:hypothetical protein